MRRTMQFAAAAALAAMCCAGDAAAQTTTFNYHTWISPQHQQNADVIPTWKKAVEEATQGRVKIEVSYPPGVNPAGWVERVMDGVSDIAWGFHGYNPGRFVVSQIAELPGLDADAEQCSVAYERTQKRFLDKAGEHKGVKLLTVFCHGAGVLHTRQPVTSIEQMKGMKIRNGGGVGADVGNALGFASVPAPASKVYEILSQGVADGTLMPMEVQATFKLKEVTPNMLVLPGGFYYGSFFTLMNQAKFNKLSKADQAAVDKASGEVLAQVTGKFWAAGDNRGLAEAKAAGTKVTTASGELAKQIHEKLAHLERDWIEKASKKGIDARAALQALRDEVKKLKTKS